MIAITLRIFAGRAFAGAALRRERCSRRPSRVVALAAHVHAQAQAPRPRRCARARRWSSSANRYASEAGLEILREGGSAVDAAIAVQLVLTLVEPQSSGVGGGAFMLFYGAPQGCGKPAIVAYEGRETAPAAATPDMFMSDNGRPASFAHGRRRRAFGRRARRDADARARASRARRLPWAKLFEPAIALADKASWSRRGCMRCSTASSVSRVARIFAATSTRRPASRCLRLRSSRIRLRRDAAASSPRKAPSRCTRATSRRPSSRTVRENNVRAGRLDARGSAKLPRPRVRAAVHARIARWRVCGPQLPSSGGVTTQQILGC